MNFLSWLKFQNKDTRYPFLFLLTLSMAALGVATYFYFTGADTAIPWETVPELKTVSLPINQVNVLLQTIDIQVKGFLLTERFETALPFINSPAAALVLGFIAINLVYYLAVISTFRQLTFFAGLLLFMLLLSTFNFDLLGIHNDARQYLLMAAMLLFGGTAFALQAFFTAVSFRLRLLLFLILIGAFGTYLFTASPLSPRLVALHLVNYSSPAGMVVAILFTFWVAYENIHALLWFHTQSANPTRRFSFWQFALISGLYLLNLLLLYFQRTRILDLNITLINAFLVLVISGVVGLWGTKRREKIYQNFFYFENGASFLYLVFGIITIISIGYAFATANDSLIRAYTDLIIYTHLAFGTFFLIYLLLNFGGLIRQKLQVYKVVYDPKVIPLFAVFVLGTILVLLLVARSNFSMYAKGKAGYFNYLGDFYKAANDTLLADRFYLEGDTYDNYNLKSNYARAALYHEKLYLQTEINLLKNALRVYPNDKMYSRLANKFTDPEDFFDQLFLLREGLRVMPHSGPLLNNQALLYSTTSLTDSAEYFFNLAHDYTRHPEVIQSNRLAFYLQHGFGKEANEMAGNIQHPTYGPLQSNILLLQNLEDVKLLDQSIAMPQAPMLTPESFALLYHGALKGQIIANQNTLNKINEYLNTDANQPYFFDLSILKAFVQKNAGQTLASRTTLENLAATESQYAGYLLDMIGLQLLQQKLYASAADHFVEARGKGWPQADIHLVYVLALQADKQADALQEAINLFRDQQPEIRQQADRMAYLLQASPTDIITQRNDSVKVQYLQLNQENKTRTAQEFVAIASTVQDTTLKQTAQKETAVFYISHGNLPAAAQVIAALLPQLTELNQLLSEVNVLQAEILLRSRDLPQLEQAVSRMYLSEQDQPLKFYYLAQLAEAQNRKPVAKKYYDQALLAMPYHEPTVLAAANFYTTQLPNPDRAYNLLLDCITYNPNAPEIYKAYILKSIDQGYFGFAESALEDLGRLVSPTEFAAFRSRYEQKLAEWRAGEPTGNKINTSAL